MYSIYDLDAEKYLCYDANDNMVSWRDHCPNAVHTDSWIYDTYDKIGRADDLDDFLVAPVDENGVNFIDAINLNEFMDKMDIIRTIKRVKEQAEFDRGFFG